MPFLHATDSWLWDSAGATPFPISIDATNQVQVNDKQISLNAPKYKPDQISLKRGCPAMRSIAGDHQVTVLDEVVEWVQMPPPETTGTFPSQR